VNADSDCTGNDLILMAASKLNIADLIIMSIHYEPTHQMLDASKTLGSQMPSSTNEEEPVNMALTTSADAEGFWTIDPPDHFFNALYVSPTNSPRSPVGLDKHIDMRNDQTTSEEEEEKKTTASGPANAVMTEKEALSKGLTSGMPGGYSCPTNDWGNCTGCREHDI